MDEYQDIKELEYRLISALAGRTNRDQDQRLNLFAVGDDDQNIYGFSGSSSKYIKRFEEDYRARPSYLTENYRSTGHIVAAANSLIEPARQRMKADRPITVNRARARESLGGGWERLDPVTRGRVQVLPAGDDPMTQAQVVVQEMKRMSALDPGWDWSSCAVIARNWDSLDPVRALCHLEDIPVQLSREDFTGTWQLRETQALLERSRVQSDLVKAEDLLRWLQQQPQGPWNELLLEAMENYQLETGNGELPAAAFREWLAEWARDNRRRQRSLLLTSAHRAKGLEFDHVVILDGKLALRQPGRGCRRSPSSLLRGDDARQEDPHAGEDREFQPVPSSSACSSVGAGQAGAGVPCSYASRTRHDLPPVKSARRAAQLRRLPAAGTPGPPGHRWAVPRRTAAGQDRPEPVGAGDGRRRPRGKAGAGVQGAWGIWRCFRDRAGHHRLGQDQIRWDIPRPAQGASGGKW